MAKNFAAANGSLVTAIPIMGIGYLVSLLEALW